MAVVAKVVLKGVTVEQYRAMSQRINAQLTDGPEGAISHLCYGSDGDLTIVDVWEDEAACRKFLALIGPIAEEQGRQIPEPEFYEVFSQVGT